VPKKRKNMKEINKKEAIGDLLDAFTEVCNSPDQWSPTFFEPRTGSVSEIIFTDRQYK